MSDLISRQVAIEAIDRYYKDKRYITRSRTILSAICRDMKSTMDSLPSAQPEKRTEERTETHACDLIDREAAVDAIYHHLPSVSRTRARAMLHEVPSAQPEIIRCKDCGYGEQDEVGRWFCRSLGCQIGNEDGSGYCADAERRE